MSTGVVSVRNCVNIIVIAKKIIKILLVAESSIIPEIDNNKEDSGFAVTQPS